MVISGLNRYNGVLVSTVDRTEEIEIRKVRGPGIEVDGRTEL